MLLLLKKGVSLKLTTLDSPCVSVKLPSTKIVRGHGGTAGFGQKGHRGLFGIDVDVDVDVDSTSETQQKIKLTARNPRAVNQPECNQGNRTCPSEGRHTSDILYQGQVASIHEQTTIR